MTNKKIIIAVFITLGLLQANMVFADANNDFEKYLKNNDMQKLEKLVNSKPKKMNWAWCLGYVIQGNGNLNNASTVIKLLSRNGADMNIAYMRFSNDNRTLWSPLSLLFANSEKYTTRQLLDVAETLIAEGADVNGNKARDGGSPISFALCYNQVELASLLLEKGADVKDGATLAWAAHEGLTDIVPALIAKGANMNYKGFGTGKAPTIVIAALMNHFDIVRLLVDKGASVNLRHDDGKTAASIAYEKGEIEVYNYLKAHGAIDFEPKQVAQASPAASPQSTTNVYVAPSSQSAAPAQSAPAQPSYRLQPGSVNGTYRGSAGGSMQISYTTVAFFDSANKSSGGSASLSGSTLTVSFSYGPLGGRSFTYTIDSDSQFSGNGETYRR